MSPKGKSNTRALELDCWGYCQTRGSSFLNGGSDNFLMLQRRQLTAIMEFVRRAKLENPLLSDYHFIPKSIKRNSSCIIGMAGNVINRRQIVQC